MKTKIIHSIIHSREQLETAAGELAQLKLEHACVTTAMEMEVAAAQKRHQPRLQSLAQQIESREAGLQSYCQREKGALFALKKSLDLMLATVGFRTSPPRVEKLDARESWCVIARRLAKLDWGRDYLHLPAPEVNKERLLAHRARLTPEQLHEAGIKFEQGENFYLEIRSEVVAPVSVREAA